MKNICFFNSTVNWGGGEKLYLEYALKFKSKRYKVVFFTSPGSPLHKKSDEANIQSDGFPIRSLTYLNPYRIFKLYTFFITHKIDVVFFSATQDMKAGGIAAKFAGVKKIIFFRDQAEPIRRFFINRLIYKSITTHIIASSEETARQMLKNYTLVIPEQKVKVIYHGIDLQEFDKQKYNKIIHKAADEIIIGTAGTFSKMKDQTYLIDIAVKLKAEGINFKLFIAGSGELEGELKKLSERFNLQDHIIFMGFINNLKSFMTDLDLFILPSISEGFGYVLIEAMAASKPVVAFNTRTNPEIIKDGKTGFLVNFPDTALFKEKVKLLITDQGLRQEMGKRARAHVEQSFNINQKITEIENLVLKTR